MLFYRSVAGGISLISLNMKMARNPSDSGLDAKRLGVNLSLTSISLHPLIMLRILYTWLVVTISQMIVS